MRPLALLCCLAAVVHFRPKVYGRLHIRKGRGAVPNLRPTPNEGGVLEEDSSPTWREGKGFSATSMGATCHVAFVEPGKRAALRARAVRWG